jgi:hypothetical protein
MAEEHTCQSHRNESKGPLTHLIDWEVERPMKEDVAFAVLAAYAVTMFVAGLMWERLRKSWRQASEKASTYVGRQEHISNIGSQQ